MTEASVRARKRRRIEVRVTAEEDELIRQAAGLADESVTRFILDTVTARAAAVVEQSREMTLSNEAFDRFFEALDAPATVVPELQRLFAAHEKLP